MHTTPPNWLDYLVQELREGEITDMPEDLSDSERLYVALATNRIKHLHCSIPAALARIGPEWREHLVLLWQYT